MEQSILRGRGCIEFASFSVNANGQLTIACANFGRLAGNFIYLFFTFIEKQNVDGRSRRGGKYRKIAGKDRF